MVVTSVNQDSDGRCLHAALSNRSSAPSTPPPRSTMWNRGFSSDIRPSSTQRRDHACPPTSPFGGLQ